jgi:hypothetical protein
MIVTSIGASIGISAAMDLVGLRLTTYAPVQIIVAAALFNATCVLQSLVGGIIEWRRPGHTIGRLLMLSGPGYGFVSAGWTTAGTLQPFVDPQLYLVATWAVFMLSYPVVAFIAGWVPLLFPTGRLPSPRWRFPIAVLVLLSTIGSPQWRFARARWPPRRGCGTRSESTDGRPSSSRSSTRSRSN